MVTARLMAESGDLPIETAADIIAVQRVLKIPVSTILHSINTQHVHVVPPDSIQLTTHQRNLLALGASFVSTPARLRGHELGVAIVDLCRRVAWRAVFHGQPTRPPPPLGKSQDWTGSLPDRNDLAFTAANQLFKLCAATAVPCLADHDLDRAQRILAGHRTRDGSGQLNTDTTTVLDQYTHLPASKVHNNLNKQLIAVRNALPPDCVIYLADKNMGLTVMTRQWYNDAVNTMLGDAETFTAMAAEDVPDYVRRLQQRVEDCADQLSRRLEANRYDAQQLRRRLTQLVANGKPSKYYIMPKLHKSPTGTRGISPMHQFWTTPLHELLSRLLWYQMLQKPWCIISAVEAISRFENRVVHGSHLLWTADIHAMYTKIPLDKLFEDTASRMTGGLFFALYGLIDPLLQLVLRHTLVTYAGRWYRQKNGIPMGSAAAPVLAVLYVTQFETDNWRNHPSMQMYVRYIDDLLGDWAGSRTTLDAHLNQLFPYSSGLRLDAPVVRTAEELITNPLPFLDLEIYSEPAPDRPGYFRLLCRPYFKQLSAHQFVAYRSGHPGSCKRSIVFSELLRQLRLCSTYSDWIGAIHNVQQWYGDRGYTDHHIRTALQRLTFSDRAASIARVLGSYQRKRAVKHHPWYNRTVTPAPAHDPSNAPVFAVRIRYDPRVAPALRSLRRSMQQFVGVLAARGVLPDGSRVVIAFTRNRNLLDYLRTHNNNVLLHTHTHTTVQPITC